MTEGDTFTTTETTPEATTTVATITSGSSEYPPSFSSSAIETTESTVNGLFSTAPTEITVTIVEEPFNSTTPPVASAAASTSFAGTTTLAGFFNTSFTYDFWAVLFYFSFDGGV
jgi:hypothetical protein